MSTVVAVPAMRIGAERDAVVRRFAGIGDLMHGSGRCFLTARMAAGMA